MIPKHKQFKRMLFIQGKILQHLNTLVTGLVADAELFKRVEVGEELEVHMLGVEKEVEMKEAFLVGSGTFYVLPDPLHGMTFPFPSTKNPLWTQLLQT